MLEEQLNKDGGLLGRKVEVIVYDDESDTTKAVTAVDRLIKRDRVVARNTAFYLARKHTDLSLVDIGRRFNRKHSTVIKGIASVEQEVSRKTSLGNQIARTMSQLSA